MRYYTYVDNKYNNTRTIDEVIYDLTYEFGFEDDKVKSLLAILEVDRKVIFNCVEGNEIKIMGIYPTTQMEHSEPLCEDLPTTNEFFFESFKRMTTNNPELKLNDKEDL